MSKTKLPVLEKYFKDALKSGLLKYEVDTRHVNAWLAVYYWENLGYTPSVDGSKWALVCAQSLADYIDTSGVIIEEKLVSRITLMLAERLRSAQQDVNGLLKENKK